MANTFSSTHTCNDLTLEHLSALIRYAQQMLDLSSESIVARFSDYPFSLIEYHEKDQTGNAIEIQFDKEDAALMGYFDENRKCEYVFIYPENLKLPVEHVRYLNSTYMHDFHICRWNIQGRTLVLRNKDNKMDYYFILYRDCPAEK